jgi:replication factor A1
MYASPDDEQLLNSPHILQVLSVKLLPQQPKPNTVDRYRIIISDGLNFIQAMIATQLNVLIAQDQIVKNSIIKVTRLTSNLVQGKKLHIILGCEVVQKVVSEKIGDPQALKGDGEPTPAPASNPTPNTPFNSVPPKQTFGASSSTAPKPGRHGNILPIEGLSPYQNNWTIKARASAKSEIKHWTNARGEGKLFNVTFIDETGEIRATGFNAAVDELYDRIQDGKVYIISKGRINLAKKKFSNVQNDYEISLERNTEIEECFDSSGVPTIKYKFIPIASLQDTPKDTIVDVVSILKEITPVSTIITKSDQKQLSKRELVLVDQSNFSIRLTLFGKQADSFDYPEGCVVAFKGLRVGDFGGRSLNFNAASTMSAPNPDIPESHALKGWYDSSGSASNFQTHSLADGNSNFAGSEFKREEVRSLHDVRESQMGTDTAETFFTQATIMHIKTDNISYPACHTEKCNKKVVDTGSGWRCEKCDKSFDTPSHRYIFSVAVADWSGQLWLSGFNEAGLAIFAMSADELLAIRERDEGEFNAIMHKASTQVYNFNCKAKMETFNDQARMKYTITRLTPVNYREDAVVLRNLLLDSQWSR